MYGWTKENKLRFGENVVGIQYEYNHEDHYDGVSEWQCGPCKCRVGRWTNQILEPGKAEPRFGGK